MVGPSRGLAGGFAVRERLGFRAAWLIGSTRLRLSAGRAIHALPPSGPDAEWYHLAVVARPPAHVVSSLAPALDRLREVGPHHHHYPPDSMHLTVGGVGRFLGGPGAADRYAELRAIVGSRPGFELTLRGLGVSPGTVFAQVFPHDGTLRALRADLRSLAHPEAARPALGARVRDLLPHVNVVRFSGRVSADLVDEVSGVRQAWFGRWTVRELEIVRADALLSREGKQVLARIPLAPVHRGAYSGFQCG